jgi:hypothetical protein
LDVKILVEILEELAERLEMRGFNVIGRRLQQGRAPEDWVIQVFIAVNLGKVVGIKVFNLLAVPSSPHPWEALGLPRAACRISARTRAHHLSASPS